MLKTWMLAAGVIVGSLVLVPMFQPLPASAARCCGAGPGGPVVGGGGGSSEQPGGPGGGGDGGDLPAVSPEDQIAKMAETCNAGLSNLVKIPPSMVASFASEGGVSVVPVCNSGLGKRAAVDNSQALPLQPAIAANPALDGPLKQGGFSADNVVGVVLVKGVATLYVHKGM